ncbi:MAG: UDP-glucose 4-epimerase GalE [Candidatus Melainabacteria bacterium RIFCSPHIGHO2_02_FULL_34_12]|nr:MAG: UDP-glucose 4-epimerase GalE [Candidatus Melainabacteria bacterium RIFCSPHIGHO2_02_FULL_34_12]
MLITGGAGYIGGITTETLHKEGFNLVVLDDLSTGHKENLFKDFPFYNGKIGDVDILKKIFSENKIDLVIHMAGAALVKESMLNPQKYFDINFCQGENLLDVMNLFGVKKIVFSSSCAVYGIPKESDIPINEDVQTKPVNPYGESKLLFEKALEWHKKSNDLDYISLRYFNVAGSSDTRGENHSPETHLIPLVVKAAKDPGYKLNVFGNDYPTKDGTVIRDYIHIIDLANAHICAINTLIKGEKHQSTYNVGYGQGYSVLEIVNAAKEVLKKEINYVISERREGDPPVLIADTRKIQHDLNWKPRYNNIHEIISSASRFTN